MSTWVASTANLPSELFQRPRSLDAYSKARFVGKQAMVMKGSNNAQQGSHIELLVNQWDHENHPSCIAILSYSFL